MTIKETTATVYVTEDGVTHASIEDAREHQFRQQLEKWTEANCWTGMSASDVADAIIGDKIRLAIILKEYLG